MRHRKVPWNSERFRPRKVLRIRNILLEKKSTELLRNNAYTSLQMKKRPKGIEMCSTEG